MIWEPSDDWNLLLFCESFALWRETYSVGNRIASLTRSYQLKHVGDSKERQQNNNGPAIMLFEADCCQNSASFSIFSKFGKVVFEYNSHMYPSKSTRLEYMASQRFNIANRLLFGARALETFT